MSILLGAGFSLTCTHLSHCRHLARNTPGIVRRKRVIWWPRNKQLCLACSFSRLALLILALFVGIAPLDFHGLAIHLPVAPPDRSFHGKVVVDPFLEEQGHTIIFFVVWYCAAVTAGNWQGGQVHLSMYLHGHHEPGAFMMDGIELAGQGDLPAQQGIEAHPIQA